ncbi:torsin-4A [Tiliqua scincoides]|uniref:torsin-4A n=1 Tax=Tiliqua scincoides TaxID=71010 RepID=UPI0034635317
MDGRKTGGSLKNSQKLSLLSSPVRAVVRLRRSARLLKKGLSPTDPQRKLLQRQISLGKAKLGGSSATLLGQASFESSQYFTFDTSVLQPVTRTGKRTKKRKSRRVLYPGSSRRYLPTEHTSKAKQCLLLLVGIICFQILNAIENLDDNILKYDLDGLEKTMHREVFGQTLAIENIMGLLKDYLATHIHSKPLVVSFNGPSGVGKSHIGWLLAKHFRSVMGSNSVLHYFTMHHCPDNSSTPACQSDLSKTISEMVTQAEIEEKIPLFILDEVELMSPALLDTLGRFFQTNQTNEFLNAVYILISNLGGDKITDVLLEKVAGGVLQPQWQAEELRTALRPVLNHIHPLWALAEIVPFVLLEKNHILSCFYEEMMSEGLYPDPSHLESLAGQLRYYTRGEQQYAITGCKQVVAQVNLL